MAEKDRTPGEAAKLAFTASDRIEAQLPRILAFSKAMDRVAAGEAQPPKESDCILMAEAVSAVAYWTGVLQTALCDIRLGLPEGGQE